MGETTTPENNTDRKERTVSGRLHKFVMPVFSKGDEVIVSLPGGPQQGKVFAIYGKYGWTDETKYEVRGKNIITITSARTMELCNG